MNDRRVDANGQRQRFTSELLPSYMRRAPKVTEVLPILYLRGLSTGDFQQALPVLLGEDAAGLVATKIARLTASWEAEYHTWRRRGSARGDYVYVWVDGVHFRVRLEEDRLCTLVMIGVRAGRDKGTDRGRRRLSREHRELGDGAARFEAPWPARAGVAVGDSALGFWAAVGAVWPETREQRYWVHRLGNILDKLPEATAAESEAGAPRDHVRADARGREAGIDAFATEYDPKYPKAVTTLETRPGAAAHVLRLPRGALAPSAHDQRHRVPVRDRPAAPAGDQGRGLTHEGAHDGLQAARDGGRALAKGEWLGAPAARARRRPLRRRRARQAEGRCWRGEGERRLTHAAIHNIPAWS